MRVLPSSATTQLVPFPGGIVEFRPTLHGNTHPARVKPQVTGKVT